MTFDSFVLAMGTPAQSGANPLVQFIPFALVLAIFYFVILLPIVIGNRGERKTS